MQPNRYIVIALYLLSFSFLANTSFAQLGFSFDLKKPKEYEERTLRSEKSDSKKFGLPARFIQNTTTHYNYFFNANNKLNDIIARAKERHKDDLSSLLSFYNYDLETTQKDSLELDSVIFKSTTGIVLHDLRSDWADNMYLLWGAAYYLKKEFDSAYLTFQFINYAFASKEKDGYYKYIGSRMDDNTPMSISTNEKRSLPKRIFSMPPSRNDAFIWQIRTFLAQDAFPEAASIIATLKSDPLFPKRLQRDLEEVQAWYFYKQNMWDSSATHLAKALDNATSKQEKARWEFLAAQMYELSHNYAMAQQYYEKSIGHTIDPVMAVYARLYATRIDQTGGDNFIQKNIDALVNMAKRERYADYRDIIYYMAAQMEIERNNIGGAQQLLAKAAEFNSGNVSQHNKAYLKLGELAFANKDYRQAQIFYDSVQLADPELKNIDEVRMRKDMLTRFAFQNDILMRQDSLQRIANMPEEERKDFVKKILKDLRKQQGFKDDGTKGSGLPAFTTPDLFSSQTKGEWYFYNASMRTKGAADFAARWGNRPNVDNWRRASAISNQVRQNGRLLSNQPNAKLGKDTLNNTSNQPDELTFDALYDKLPLTAEKLKASNDSIRDAMFELGKIYSDALEDCGATINTYEQLRSRFPDFAKMDEVLFHLYYCYNKNGDISKAAQVKTLLTNNYPKSNFTKTTNSGTNLATEATKTYEKIYDLFVEGNFDEAIAQKKAADSLYGNNYWTPQLLYIEAVYYVKQRNDSSAINSLNTIKTKYPASPLAPKAITMIDVLKRRKQIETELTNMQVVRMQDQPRKIVDTTTTRPVVKTDTTAKKIEQAKIENKPQQKTDTAAKKPITIPFAFNPNTTYSVMVILNKVDGIFASETRNSFDTYNRSAFPRPFTYESVILTGETRILLIKAFANAQAAIDYIQRVKPATATQILSWLKPEKYSFSIISDSNLELLKANPDIDAYKRFMEQNLPGKF